MAEKKFSMEYDRHDFTDEEKLEFSKELGRILSEAESAEDEMKAVKSQFKSEIDRLKADISDLGRKLQNGYEMRQVKCEMVMDPKTKRVYYYRCDTGALVKDRKMFADEQQMHFDDLGEEETENP